MMVLLTFLLLVVEYTKDKAVTLRTFVLSCQDDQRFAAQQ